jgi:hypothetical protein
MSTGCNCELLEVKKGEWWYVLEDYSAPKNSWDWREYASAYGPFGTKEIALKHLRDNHANPGGYSSMEYTPDYRPDEVMLKLMAEAAERKKRDALMRFQTPVFRYW